MNSGSSRLSKNGTNKNTVLTVRGLPQDVTHLFLGTSTFHCTIMMIRALRALKTEIHNFSRNIASLFSPNRSPQLELAGFPRDCVSTSSLQPSAGPTLADCLWLAVPKSKVSRSKKRMKTTNQKRIKLKENIIVDKRTGELTLSHKLPFNWKDYLPETSFK